MFGIVVYIVLLFVVSQVHFYKKSTQGNNEAWVPSKADPYDNGSTGEMGACCAEMNLERPTRQT